jgi:hypothetical protein
MRRLLPRLAVACAAAAAGAAQARGDGDLWILLVAPMCLSQDAAYRESPLGRLPLFARMADQPQPFHGCLRDGRWASKALCDDLMALDEGRLADPEPVFQRHLEELRAMAPALNYMSEVYAGHAAACPPAAAASAAK